MYSLNHDSVRLSVCFHQEKQKWMDGWMEYETTEPAENGLCYLRLQTFVNQNGSESLWSSF